MGSFDTSENDKALEAIFSKPQHDPKSELLALLEKMPPEEIAELLNRAKR